MPHVAPVVVVADDFGHSVAINAGIVRAFEAGLITNTSLMANMEGFEEAVAAAEAGGFTAHLGVHLNLVEGRPLTDPMHRCGRFVDGAGQFIWKHRNVWSLSAQEQSAIRTELAAQITQVRAAGIPISHLDSHRHAHTAWPIGTIVIDLARTFGVRTIRLSRNCGRTPRLPIRLYKQLFNARLRAAGLSRIVHFGDPHDVASLIAQATAPMEIMVHPTCDAQGAVRDDRNGELLADQLAPLHLAGRLQPFESLYNAN